MPQTDRSTQENAEEPEAEEGKVPSGACISPTKFVVLSVLTLGLYQTYWAWRMWEIVRCSNGETYRFKSSLRALFLSIGSFWLFPAVYEVAKAKGCENEVKPRDVAIFYLAVGFLSGGLQDVLEGRVLLSFLALVFCIGIQSSLLLPIVQVQNAYVTTTQGKFVPKKTNWWLFVTLVICFILFLTSYVVSPVTPK